MEVLTTGVDTAENRAHEIASVLEDRVIKIIPVPYAGDEEVTYIIQKPIDKFMAEKPA